MSQIVRGAPRYLVVGIAMLAVVVVAAGVYVLSGGGDNHGTAYFKTVKGVYPKDAIRILGIEVGKIDKITPEGDQMRVDFSYDSQYKVPANASAAIVSPTLVATRFIQLTPAYDGGPTLPDDGVIPVDRTASPVEFDELKNQLSQLSDSLGPNGVNSNGALNRALTAIDTNGRGQGQPFHDMIVQLSAAAKTVAGSRGDLFGTVRNLAAFSATLDSVDKDMEQFNNQLADVSDILDDNSEKIKELIPAIDDAAELANHFVSDNGDRITTTLKDAGSIMRNLAQQRDNIATLLHIGPNTVTNFNNIYSPRVAGASGLVDPDFFAGAGSPGDEVCAIISQANAGSPTENQNKCVEYLGPLLRYLRMAPAPVGFAPPVNRGGGHYPTYGDPSTEQANTDGHPESSQLPSASNPTNGLSELFPGGK
jgi:phospholipid/cholesterol/gamma-HCH transport system substrate-binding protein